MDDVNAELQLLRLLLSLHEAGDPEELLVRATDLAREATGAAVAWLAIHAPEEDTPRWWHLSGPEACSDEVRRWVSSTIVRRSLGQGDVLRLDDPKSLTDVARATSVRGRLVGPVLCAPLGARHARGVLYLERDARGEPFRLADVETVQRVVRTLVPLAHRFELQQPHDDPTARYRSLLADSRAIVGRSQALATCLAELALAAQTELNTLICGPTGTGKTTLARLLHASSDRREGPFEPVSAANMSDEAFEAQLFGTRRGDFTGAVNRDGIVPRARGGTVFLDEVHALTPRARQKLLQVLDTGTYRLHDEAQQAEVRWVFATDVPLDELRTTFPAALMQRLAATSVRVPSLAERPLDVPAIASALAAGLGIELDASAMRWIAASPWENNVRQLRDDLQRAQGFARLEGANVVQAEHFLRTRPGSETAPTFREFVDRARRNYLQHQLEAASWNVATAATASDLPPATMYRWMTKLGLQRS